MSSAVFTDAPHKFTNMSSAKSQMLHTTNHRLSPVDDSYNWSPGGFISTFWLAKKCGWNHHPFTADGCRGGNWGGFSCDGCFWIFWTPAWIQQVAPKWDTLFSESCLERCKEKRGWAWAWHGFHARGMKNLSLGRTATVTLLTLRLQVGVNMKIVWKHHLTQDVSVAQNDWAPIMIYRVSTPILLGCSFACQRPNSFRSPKWRQINL